MSTLVINRRRYVAPLLAVVTALAFAVLLPPLRGVVAQTSSVLQCSSVALDKTTGLAIGDKVTASGTCQANTDYQGVTQSDPIRVATFRTDASGRFSVAFTLPTNLDPGTHTFTVRTLANQIVGTANFTVVGTTATTIGGGQQQQQQQQVGGLSRTGVNALAIALFGTVSLALGSFMVLQRQAAGISKN